MTSQHGVNSNPPKTPSMPQSDIRATIEEIVSIVSAFSSDHGFYPHEGKLLPAAQSEEEAVDQIMQLINAAVIAELENTLTMNGVHPGDWEVAIKDRLAKYKENI